jgi:chromate transporter
VIVIGLRSIVDIPTALVATVSVLALIYIKKLQEPVVIAIAAAVGILVKML